MELTEEERLALTLLIDLTLATYFALEDSEELLNGDTVVGQESIRAIDACLDSLSGLPDDRPGYTLGPDGKAAWALRRLLKEEV